MKTIVGSVLVLWMFVCTPVPAAAQPPVGALALDEGQGDQYGWAVDYQTSEAARDAALRECGPGSRVVLTFPRCGAYAADQDADSTAVGWAESSASAEGARQAALSECGSRDGSGCIVRVWGCNGHVVEEGLGLDRSARRQIQERLHAQGFDPGGADGTFGPRTRAAIRSWQTSRGARATGYLDGASAAALRPFSAAPPATTAEQETVFWQSVMNSTNPAEFEAYLSQFPNGVFRALAETRLTALRAAANTGSLVSGADDAASGTAAGGDAPRRLGEVFRDCAECPEMVVLPGGGLAMGRYEVTVGEYRAFASATGGGAGGGCFEFGADSWQNPGFRQTDRHPVTCVNWDDAQEYVSWLSRRTGLVYRLPTEAEWERAASGSQAGCYEDRTGTRGTCPVGSYGSNAAGLSDMVGSVWEWTSDCWLGDCGRRVFRGGSWGDLAESLRPSARAVISAGRSPYDGFRVSRTLD